LNQLLINNKEDYLLFCVSVSDPVKEIKGSKLDAIIIGKIPA
jgi:hypothetical protein